METRLKVKRIWYAESELTGQKEVRSSKSMLDLNKVSDYEEYVGGLQEVMDKPMTTVLVENHHNFEYKVIIMEFEEFHKKMEELQQYKEKLDGIRRSN